MSGWVLDASAVLAWLQGESGSELVEDVLSEGVISVVNWSEVLQKSVQNGRDPEEVGQLLTGLGINVVPAEETDALTAAILWASASHLSLADCFCMTLALHLECPVITADTSWAQASVQADIRYLR